MKTSLPREGHGETSSFLVVVDDDGCGFPGSIITAGKDSTTSSTAPAVIFPNAQATHVLFSH